MSTATLNPTATEYKVADISLAEFGRKEISIAEFEMIGFDDFCYPESVVLIEWADKIESALEGINYMRIELFHAGDTQRKIHIDKTPAHIAL